MRCKDCKYFTTLDRDWRVWMGKRLPSFGMCSNAIFGSYDGGGDEAEYPGAMVLIENLEYYTLCVRQDFGCVGFEEENGKKD